MATTMMPSARQMPPSNSSYYDEDNYSPSPELNKSHGGSSKPGKISFSIDSLLNQSQLISESKDALKQELAAGSPESPTCNDMRSVHDLREASFESAANSGSFSVNGHQTWLHSQINPLSLLNLRIPVPVNPNSVHHYTGLGYNLAQVRAPLDVYPCAFARQQSLQGK